MAPHALLTAPAVDVGSIGAMMDHDQIEFELAEKGMTRFPPNIEQISVECRPICRWLIVRRNDVTLRFPLTDAACRHLAELLIRDPADVVSDVGT